MEDKPTGDRDRALVEALLARLDEGNELSFAIGTKRLRLRGTLAIVLVVVVAHLSAVLWVDTQSARRHTEQHERIVELTERMLCFQFMSPAQLDELRERASQRGADHVAVVRLYCPWLKRGFNGAAAPSYGQATAGER